MTAVTAFMSFGIIFAIIIAYMQIKQNAMIKKAEFWLEIRTMFSKFEDINTNLRPAGKWSLNSITESTDWTKIDAYMGLFEHCQIMIKDGFIDENTFKDIYLYRIKNIVQNKEIVENKLVSEKIYWTHFLDLLKRYDIKV